jgi:hypothetical protein
MTWLLIGAAALVLLGVLAWAARNVGGSTPEGDAFMAHLGGGNGPRTVRPLSGVGSGGEW